MNEQEKNDKESIIFLSLKPPPLKKIWNDFELLCLLYIEEEKFFITKNSFFFFLKKKKKKGKRIEPKTKKEAFLTALATMIKKSRTTSIRSTLMNWKPKRKLSTAT